MFTQAYQLIISEVREGILHVVITGAKCNSRHITYVSNPNLCLLVVKMQYKFNFFTLQVHMYKQLVKLQNYMKIIIDSNQCTLFNEKHFLFY